MRTFLRIVGVLALILVIAAAALWFVGPIRVIVAVFGPNHGWDEKLKAPPPDYADATAWAALPSKRSPAMDAPAGADPDPAAPQVDVFFIHPTGYMHGQDWNSPLDPNSQTEENTRWMMANQASAFSGCCAVYAPRYREASIFYYFAGKQGTDVGNKTFDLAYSDVSRAFDYFLTHYSKGRPFILASHSQGTAHAFHLLKDRIDGTPFAKLLVAAYLIGGGITDKDAATLKTVHVCNSPTDTHCFVHWATWAEHRTLPQVDRSGGKLVCVNPLTWMRDGPLAPATLHKGAAPPSGRFQIAFWGSDRASGITFPPLGKPLPHFTWAACEDGLLTVADQKTGPFASMDLGGGNYHGLDYPLFAMDIRQNAEARARAYMGQAAR
jgi:hypothetical protein